MRARVFLLAGLGALSGCQHVAVPLGPPRSVSFERINAGMAVGPAYVVTLSSDGSAELKYTSSSRMVLKGEHGPLSTPTLGASQVQGKISAARAAAVFAKLDAIGFWDLEPSYRSKTIETKRKTDSDEVGSNAVVADYVTDLPTQIITAVRDGVSKSVEDYYGTPSGVKELEALIDQNVTFQLEPRLAKLRAN